MRREIMADDLFDPRLTEHRNPNTINIDSAGAAEIVDLINAEDRTVPQAVHSQRDEIARAIETAVECFRAGGRLIYVGAGTSGRLGVLDATECPPTFGVEPDMVRGIIAGGYMALVRSQEGAEDRGSDGVAAMDEAGVGPNDFVLGIAASGTTAFVRAALERAAECGAKTGFLCCSEPGAEMRQLVDVSIVPLVGPEVIAGSTRMKAGTATKLVLNTITTGAMVLLGKVYENLMVDLKAVSEKLVDRSRRIVMAITGATREEASAAIEEAEGSLKVAILMQSAGVGRGLAECYVAEAGGRVREAMERAQTLERTVSSRGDALTPHPTTPLDANCLQRTLVSVRQMPKTVSMLVGDGVGEERLEARPSPDTWCIKEHIEHLIVFDQVADRRLSVILSSDDPPPSFPNWDEKVENAKISESGAIEAPIEQLLMRLADGRAKLAARVEASNAEDFARTGRHEVLGDVSVYQLLGQIVWHDDRHVRAIRRLLTD